MLTLRQKKGGWYTDFDLDKSSSRVYYEFYEINVNGNERTNENKCRVFSLSGAYSGGLFFIKPLFVPAKGFFLRAPLQFETCVLMSFNKWNNFHFILLRHQGADGRLWRAFYTISENHSKGFTYPTKGRCVLATPGFETIKVRMVIRTANPSATAADWTVSLIILFLRIITGIIVYFSMFSLITKCRQVYKFVCTHIHKAGSMAK